MSTIHLLFTPFLHRELPKAYDSLTTPAVNVDPLGYLSSQQAGTSGATAPAPGGTGRTSGTAAGAAAAARWPRGLSPAAGKPQADTPTSQAQTPVGAGTPASVGASPLASPTHIGRMVIIMGLELSELGLTVGRWMGKNLTEADAINFMPTLDGTDDITLQEITKVQLTMVELKVSQGQKKRLVSFRLGECQGEAMM